MAENSRCEEDKSIVGRMDLWLFGCVTLIALFYPTNSQQKYAFILIVLYNRFSSWTANQWNWLPSGYFPNHYNRNIFNLELTFIFPRYPK